MLNDVCFNCFKSRGNFEVCPHCGYINGTKPEQEYHLYPGTILDGRYLVGTVLGFGGFGITYKAWDIKLGSIVAIKEFYPTGLVNRVPGETEVQVFDGAENANYKEYLERFMDEARNLAQFNGKANIVNVFGFFEENNTAYIVMEFLDGISLKNYVEQNGRMPVDTSLVVINDLLDGTKEVHEKGILHRDIAPDNIILTNEGNVKILDFGSARFSSDNNEKTLSAFIKPGYAAPEQYAALGEQGVWTDIYGLGATMYFMVTGIKPEESTDRLVNDTVAKPSELGVDIPIEVDKSIMKAMALPIEMRFKSIDEFAAAIAGEIPVEYPEVEIKRRKRKRNIIASLSGIGLVAAIALIFVLYQQFKVDPYENIVSEDISMWVYVDNKDYDPGKSNMPETFKTKHIQDKAKQYENQKMAYESLANNYSEYMKEKYKKEIKVNLLVFDSRDGYDVEMKKAIENDKLPDVFMASDIIDELSENCMDLSDISDVIGNGDYYFISSDNYEELYPSKKVIPLGFNAPVIYVNNSLVSDFNLYENEKDVKTSFTSIDEFKELDKSAGKMVATSNSKGKKITASIWGIDRSVYNKFIALFGNNTLSDNKNKNDNSTVELINSLKESYNANKFNSSVPVENYFYYDQLAYLVGDTSIFEYVNNYLGGNFSVIPVSNGNDYIVSLDTEVALNKKLNDNKTLIARSLIEYLISDDGQTYVDVVVGASLPLSKNVMNDYCGSVNNNFNILVDYADANVIGENRLSDENIGSKLYNDCYIGNEKADNYFLSHNFTTQPTEVQ
ncbi:MAG: protein kinase [Lachnospirales bacterium]